MSNRFRQLAVAANDGEMNEFDILMVAEMLEIDEAQRRYDDKLREIQMQRPRDRRHQMQCREAKKARRDITEQRKRDLMLLWTPGFFVDEHAH